MTDEQQPDENAQTEQDERSSTSPPEGKTHEATTPPGQGERNDEDTRTSEDKLDQAGGGH
jgi:hypothetical protein